MCSSSCGRDWGSWVGLSTLLHVLAGTAMTAKQLCRVPGGGREVEQELLWFAVARWRNERTVHPEVETCGARSRLAEAPTPRETRIGA